MTAPNICVLKTDGINCEAEMMDAFRVAGGTPELVHVNQLHSGDKRLNDYAGLGIPGGFSYGDGIASGVVLGNELHRKLEDELDNFVTAQKPIIGVCNGFQVLVRMGLLPNETPGTQQATLTHNDVGHFVCKWVDLKVAKNRCAFAPAEELAEVVPMQIAHGEGRFVAHEDTLDELQTNQQTVFTYAQNPNGSMANIAGICNASGTILGMMPHPERSVRSFHPDRAKTPAARHAATVIFSNFISYAKEL